MYLGEPEPSPPAGPARPQWTEDSLSENRLTKLLRGSGAPTAGSELGHKPPASPVAADSAGGPSKTRGPSRMRELSRAYGGHHLNCQERKDHQGCGGPPRATRRWTTKNERGTRRVEGAFKNEGGPTWGGSPENEGKTRQMGDQE